MFERLERHKPELLGLMRIAMGITFMEHGTQKLFGFPVPPPGRLALPLLLFTGFLETIGSTLLTFGSWTKRQNFRAFNRGIKPGWRCSRARFSCLLPFRIK